MNHRRRHAIFAGLAATATAVTAVLTLTAMSAPAAVRHPSQSRQSSASADGSSLDVTINEGGTTVIPLVGVTVAFTYTCNDTLGTATVPVTVTLDQGGSGGHTGSTTVKCQVTGGTATVLVPFSGRNDAAGTQPEG